MPYISCIILKIESGSHGNQFTQEDVHIVICFFIHHVNIAIRSDVCASMFVRFFLSLLNIRSQPSCFDLNKNGFSYIIHQPSYLKVSSVVSPSCLAQLKSSKSQPMCVLGVLGVLPDQILVGMTAFNGLMDWQLQPLSNYQIYQMLDLLGCKNLVFLFYLLVYGNTLE